MKYRNKPCTLGGEKYRSQREMRRHQDLLLMQKAGQISGLVREVVFVLADAVTIGGRLRPPLRYIADFMYTQLPEAKIIVEDAKGVRTEGYRIKRHLMKAVRGIEILET